MPFMNVTKEQIPDMYKRTKEDTLTCRFCSKPAMTIVTYSHPKTGTTEKYGLCEAHNAYKSGDDLP